MNTENKHGRFQVFQTTRWRDSLAEPDYRLTEERLRGVETKKCK